MSRAKPSTDVPAEGPQPPSRPSAREELVENLALLVVRQYRRQTSQAALVAPQQPQPEGDAAGRADAGAASGRTSPAR
jgi:hypothetical protein